MVDVFTQEEKVNADIAENEIKFVFKPSKELLASNVGYINYYFKPSDTADVIKGHFDHNQESVEFKHKITDIRAKDFAKEIRKRDLLVKLKKKKLVMYR